ncbi:hypothetical protein [Psychromicrobium sp. YIM B11713]|uniref:hypothetical protein n=1 Tax=Psychromicrobium sp. YIM B11713 TaxID=3145233 RepID=UPI00374FC6B4
MPFSAELTCAGFSTFFSFTGIATAAVVSFANQRNVDKDFYVSMTHDLLMFGTLFAGAFFLLAIIIGCSSARAAREKARIALWIKELQHVHNTKDKGLWPRWSRSL